MKIDNTKAVTGNLTDATVRTPAAKSGGNSPAANSAEGTSVHLGNSSAQLRSLESSVASAPAIDAMKVAEIKQAISEGRFQVNTGAVADGLIKTVSDLISASQR
ncbi:MAG: flagellar biosynthesis anti-sigma factor FlgM [Gammaproteobacteria bacterium]|nr:flagellar biosynthesis anti-sigma factor FlgM [Sideroxydans sp.]MBU3904324.1 flagellar biosynthesis anti-sigma factor FlgM [Gammaproteobacteria bacterium]MBU4045070.1 flagellar biosynthesis anti-sigma factor FlgM [Gammaproteobacteria bacterium]MBU4150903.1 flagellar biosynthesis anti-sigma factor FlgM [Gammaproteobacteria bacterium]